MSAREAQALREAPTIDPARMGPTLDPSAGDAPLAGAALAPGSFVGDWRIEAPLPGGTQAELYEVRSGGRHGVLKLYHAGFRPVPGVMLAQRDGEARHLVPLWDAGEKDGRRFEVYPRYECSTLRELVEGGRADEAFVRETLLPQLADALAFLGERGVVHADVAPDNVLVTEGAREVRLADFGVALPVPIPGELVSRRGTPAFSPRVRGRGGRVEMGPGYDYGSLGLLVAYACLGVSPIEGLSERQASLALEDGSAFSSLPRDLMRLCVALSSPLGGARSGAQACERFALGGARRGEPPAAAPVAPSSPGVLEFGVVDGGVVMVSSGRELLACAERHWDVARSLVGSSRLAAFLEALGCADRVCPPMRLVASEGPDAQVFVLCCALARELDGPGIGPVSWRGRRYDDIVALLGVIADGSEEVAGFLRAGLLATYCRVAELGDAAVRESERLARATDDERLMARSAIEVLTGRGPDLVIDGRVVPDVAALARWASTASLERISELVEGDALRGWLYRRGLDDVYREVDSVS